MEYDNYDNFENGRNPSKQESHFTEHDATITQTHAFGHQIDHLSNYELERGLKSRHIQFLALGGAIGTGLFVGSGAILSLVGPAPLFMAYLSMMLVVWIVMNDLAGKLY
jgi:yeast amino acid transporter